jgi:hypothetical protein
MSFKRKAGGAQKAPNAKLSHLRKPSGLAVEAWQTQLVIKAIRDVVRGAEAAQLPPN